jgi:AraC-like DNA-binding protein
MTAVTAGHAASFRTGSSYALPLLLQSLGQPPEAVFEAAGVDLALYSHPENRIAAVDLGRLFACAAQSTGRSEIGLLIAGEFRPDGLGLVGRLAAEGPDVSTAIRNLVRLLQYNTLAGYPTLSVSDRTAILGFDLRVSDFVGANFILEGATAIIFRFMQWFCGKSWAPEEVHLSRRAPPDRRPFDGFFGVPVNFSATEDAVMFSSDWLDRRVAREEQRQKSNRLEIAAAPFSEHVRRQVAIRLGFDPVDAAAIARELGVSRRQLFRRLQSEGTTCQKLADDVRFARARHLLEAGDAPIPDIAFALAYPDQSSFARAFKRWSGGPPGEWRRRSDQGDMTLAVQR